MNNIIPAFVIDEKNVVMIENDGYQYETFIQSDYGINNNVGALGSDERMFTCKVQIKVLGYLTSDSSNDDAPKIIRKQNLVEITVGRERVVGRNIGSGLDSILSPSGERVGIGGVRIDPNGEFYHIGSVPVDTMPEDE